MTTMGSDFYFRDKIPVAILGVTEWIGQKLVQLLARHPWFEIVALCDVDPFIGQLYGDAVTWHLSSPLSDVVANMPIQPCEPSISCSLVFSGLHFDIAPSIEMLFAEAGYDVVSRFPYSAHRFVPLLVAEVNPHHLALMRRQSFPKGKIVGTPSHLVMGLTLALKPLMDQFGLEAVQVVALQPLNEADDSREDSKRIPFVLSSEEETQIEQECLEVLGEWREEEIQKAPFKISVQCIRLANMKGTLTCLSLKLKNKPSLEKILETWHQFQDKNQQLRLPTLSFHGIHYFPQLTEALVDIPSVLNGEGIVKIVQLRPCSILDYKFNLYSSFPLQGVAELIVLNAEILVRQGKIYW